MSGERTLTNGEAWKRTTVASSISSLATATAALVGFITYQQINPPRPDPYTGKEATALRQELEGKIAASELRQITRIIPLEAANVLQLQEHTALWKEINALPPDMWERRVEALEFWVIRQDSSYHPPLLGGKP